MTPKERNDMREDFEVWVKSHGGNVDRTDGGEYRSAPTECAWNAWDAAYSAALTWADKTWGETLRQTREAYQGKIDARDVSIADVGYIWTLEMWEAYEQALNAPSGEN